LLLPRERFSYWCLDLLFLICSDTAQDQEPLRRRIAALCLPTLLQRCRLTLLSYLADDALRGNYPFPRAREEELVHILKKLHSLKLWNGSLWAALSQSPSKFALQQPNINTSQSTTPLIAEASQRSTRAHLFHFYKPLLQIAALSKKTPVVRPFHSASRRVTMDAAAGDGTVSQGAKVVTNGESLEELDARQLASACLEAVGQEWGAQ